jgi:hypothetical protein
MIDKLAAWHRNCSTLIDTIDAYTSYVSDITEKCNNNATLCSVNLQERQSDEVVQKQLQADVDVIKQSIKVHTTLTLHDAAHCQVIGIIQEQIVQGELHLADDFEHDRQRAG